MFQSYVFYLVESLATVKSIVLLFDIDDSRGEREKLLQQLYGLFFDLAPIPTVPKAAKLYLLEIGQTLVDEADSISSNIVAFLVQKLGDGRAETQKFATELIRSCADKLQPALGLYFNDKVIEFTGEAPETDKDRKKLELLKQLHVQMVQVGKVAPSALASVIPQFEEEFQASDIDIRLISIAHLTGLFAVANQETIKMYPHLWLAWMNKMNDRSPAVRIQWIRAAVELLPELEAEAQKSIQAALAEKLQDIDAKVRERVIDSLQKYLEEKKGAVLTLGSTLCEELGFRCRDTVEEVRIKALNLLCRTIIRLYEADPRHACFAACCNQLFNLIYTNERGIRIFYEYCIEHGLFIPPDNIEYSSHTEMLVSIYQTLGDEAHKAFKKWLNDKSLFVRYVSAFVKISVANPSDPRLAALIQHISSLFRVPLEAQPMLQTLPTVLFSNDAVKNIFISIGDADLSVARHQETLKAAVDFDWGKQDKRLKHYLMAFLARRASVLAIHPDFLKSILAIDSPQLLDTAQKLVSEVIAEFPSLGIKHSGLLESRICDYPEDIDSLMAYSRFSSACAESLTKNPNVIAVLKNLMLTGNRAQVKYAVRSLLSWSQERAAMADLVADLWSQLPLERESSLDSAKAIRTWQCVNECCQANLCQGLDGWQGKIVHSLQLIACREKTSYRFYGTDASLENYTEEESVCVVAVRALRNWILNLKNFDKEEELKQLRVFAPLLAESLVNLKSSRVLLAIVKSLCCLVPRPTAFTVVNNLRDLVHVCFASPMAVKESLSHLIIRQYQMGNVGMIYLVIPFIASEDLQNKSHLKEVLTSLRKTDRFADAVLPLDDTTIEINSKQLRRYEDLLIFVLLISSLYSAFADLNETTLQYFSHLVEFLVDVIATEINVSYLFDAAVQLKRHEFISEFSTRNRQLYILSEMTQNALRNRSTSQKWPLQAIKTSIVLSDDLLNEMSTGEEMARNIKKSYLIRVQEKLHEQGKRSENVSMEVDQEGQCENIDTTAGNQPLTFSSLESTPKKRLVEARRSARNRPVVGTTRNLGTSTNVLR